MENWIGLSFVKGKSVFEMEYSDYWRMKTIEIKCVHGNVRGKRRDSRKSIVGAL